MSFTLDDFRTEIRANLKATSIAQNRIDLWVNMAQNDIWQFIDPEFGKETTTFSTVASTRLYRIQASMNRILSVVDQTNEFQLTQVNETELERFDPDLNDAGPAEYYTLYGLDYVANQPSSASAITVVSSSTQDTTQTVQIIGTVSSVEMDETLTLNGTVNVVSTNSYTSIRRLSKSATTTGNITVTSNAGAVAVATLPARRRIVEYQPIRLWPVPGDVYTMLVRYVRNPIPLRDAADIPDLPEVWHTAMMDLSMGYGHDFLMEQDLGDRIRARAFARINELKAKNTHKPNYAPVIGRRFYVPFMGHLPSNFPRG